MAQVDRDKLVKFLALADSDQDGEALAAVRKASRIVRDGGLQWDDVIAVRPLRGWAYMFNVWARYVAELQRRISAERAASHWQTIARLREAEIERLKAAGVATLIAPLEPRRVTGHSLIDSLLASPDLDASRRARVEAIATWFTRTHELTVAEQADLETFARQLGAKDSALVQ
jgi:hypothetical protein